MDLQRQHYNLPSDAVWFITGCSSGIGKALANLVAAKGHRLVATARNITALSYLPSSPNILPLPLDTTSTPSIDAAIAAALSHFGRIDVMVNNAGYSYRGDTENALPSQAHTLMSTNFWGTVALTIHAMRIMREVNLVSGQQGGVILNLSSMGGRAAFPGNAFYHASKFAVEGFTESVAKEVRPEWNIRFCCVEPGGVKTEFAGRSMVAIEPHKAYDHEDSPTRMLKRYMEDEELTKGWADVEVVVGKMWELVEAGDIPLRVPLGPDAWGMLKVENEKEAKELDRWRAFSESAGKKGQFESVKWLSER
ncbi:hypothetical protein OQA88_11102 [Cercophora sp. LCS_1]